MRFWLLLAYTTPEFLFVIPMYVALPVARPVRHRRSGWRSSTRCSRSRSRSGSSSRSSARCPRSSATAARVDGCSELQTLLRVYLPLAAPGLAATAILVGINMWNEVTIALSLTFDRRPDRPDRRRRVPRLRRDPLAGDGRRRGHGRRPDDHLRRHRPALHRQGPHLRSGEMSEIDRPDRAARPGDRSRPRHRPGHRPAARRRRAPTSPSTTCDPTTAERTAARRRGARPAERRAAVGDLARTDEVHAVCDARRGGPRRGRHPRQQRRDLALPLDRRLHRGRLGRATSTSWPRRPS